jgi:hypothetical protein
MEQIINAIRRNDSHELKLLLYHFKEPIKEYNQIFIKYLEFACKNNFYEIVEILLAFRNNEGERLNGIDICIAKTYTLNNGKVNKLFYMDDRVLLEDKLFYLGIELYRMNFENFKTILDYNPDIDPLYSNNELFIRACAYGCSNIMLYLYQRYNANPADQYNRALQRACENNHRGIVQFLLTDQRVNPADRNNIIFKSSVRKNKNEIVKILLKSNSIIDPSASDNISLRYAFENQNFEIMTDILNSDKCYDTPQLKNFLANDKYVPNEIYDEVVKFYMRRETSFDFIVNHTRDIQKRLNVLVSRFSFDHFVENHRFDNYVFTLNYTLIEAFKIYFMNRNKYPLEALKIVFGIQFEEIMTYFKDYISLNKVLSTDSGSIIFSYL